MAASVGAGLAAVVGREVHGHPAAHQRSRRHRRWSRSSSSPPPSRRDRSAGRPGRTASSPQPGWRRRRARRSVAVVERLGVEGLVAAELVHLRLDRPVARRRRRLGPDRDVAPEADVDVGRARPPAGRSATAARTSSRRSRSGHSHTGRIPISASNQARNSGSRSTGTSTSCTTRSPCGRPARRSSRSPIPHRRSSADQPHSRRRSAAGAAARGGVRRGAGRRRPASTRTSRCPSATGSRASSAGRSRAAGATGRRSPGRV